MSAFDTFFVEATSNSIRALMTIDGVERKDITTKVYYGKRFPVKEHSVSIKFFSAQKYGFIQAAEKAHQMKDSLPKHERIDYSVRQIIRD